MSISCFTVGSEVYKNKAEKTQVHFDFGIMGLKTEIDPSWLDFFGDSVKTHRNYVFLEESEDGPNGDSFKVQVTKLQHSQTRRIMDYKIFYSDPQPLFDEDKEIHILTVQEDATRLGERNMEIKLHFGEPQTLYYKDNEGFKNMTSKRHEVSRAFLDIYRKWYLPIWGAKLMASGALRDRREAIGLSHTKAGRHSHLHGLPKNVLALIMRLM